MEKIISGLAQNLASSADDRRADFRPADVGTTILARDYKGLSNYASNVVIEMKEINEIAVGGTRDHTAAMEDVCPTIMASPCHGTQGPFVTDTKAVQLGNIYGEHCGTGYAGNVWDENGTAPTLLAMHSTRTPLVKEVVMVAQRGRPGADGFDQELEVNRGGTANALTTCHLLNEVVEATAVAQRGLGLSGETEQKLEHNDSGCSNTITSVQKDNYVMVRQIAPEIIDHWTWEIDGVTYLIRIRKLTPRECWRLMGCSDEDFEKAEAVNSNSQLYKQAGNSIVVNVLEELFKAMM